MFWPTCLVGWGRSDEQVQLYCGGFLKGERWMTIRRNEHLGANVPPTLAKLIGKIGRNSADGNAKFVGFPEARDRMAVWLFRLPMELSPRM
jgi:hypothetical protein